MKKRAVITGVGLISSRGTSPAQFHRHLCDGTLGPEQVEGSEARITPAASCGRLNSFDAAVYLKGRSLRPLDRTGQLFASAAQMALENSGWTASALACREVGIVLGTMFGSMHTISEFDRRCLVDGPAYVSPMNFANTVINSAASQTAIWHNLRGINSTTSTGATSGLVAIGYAADLIRFGGQTAMLAGGADELCFESACGFERAGLLCSREQENDGFIPFDQRRSGMALGESAALLMLEEWNSAEARGARILGEVRGHANVYNPGWNTPGQGASGIVRAIAGALQDAGLAESDIDCISAAANGSVAGDRNEGCAIQTAFQGESQHIPITAIKSMTGETLGAAGALQVIDMLETMRSGTLPGIAGLDQPDPELKSLNFCRTSTSVDVHAGMITSVGFDGHACSLIVSRTRGMTTGSDSGRTACSN